MANRGSSTFNRAQRERGIGIGIVIANSQRKRKRAHQKSKESQNSESEIPVGARQRTANGYTARYFWFLADQRLLPDVRANRNRQTGAKRIMADVFVWNWIRLECG